MSTIKTMMWCVSVVLLGFHWEPELCRCILQLGRNQWLRLLACFGTLCLFIFAENWNRMDTKAHRVDVTPSFPAQTLRHFLLFPGDVKAFFFIFLLFEACQSGSPGSSLVHTKLPQAFQLFLASNLSETSISSSLNGSACNYLLTQYTRNL